MINQLEESPQISQLGNSESIGEAAIILISIGSVLVILCIASVVYGLRRRRHILASLGDESKREVKILSIVEKRILLPFRLFRSAVPCGYCVCTRIIALCLGDFSAVPFVVNSRKLAGPLLLSGRTMDSNKAHNRRANDGYFSPSSLSYDKDWSKDNSCIEMLKTGQCLRRTDPVTESYWSACLILFFLGWENLIFSSFLRK
ncbi:hypothetical protein TNCV_1448541 [Trichonephila clavipes]|nr:hypothetical protein TNCV_1448541 [Trichonephila clavipes]